MAAQQRMTEDVIMNMKRALARERNAPDSEDPIEHPTNRGNKLKRNARHVHQGRLNSDYSPRKAVKIWHSDKDGWSWGEGGPSALSRDTITHAGQQRGIIYRNPPRFDEYGDVIESDASEDEDEEPNDESIYERVKLEELLRPLTSAAELSTHPTMSLPYYAKHLTQMVEQMRATLQKEQQTLYRVKNALTSFRGDSDWFPCGAMETEFDSWFLKEQRPLPPADGKGNDDPSDVEAPMNGMEASITVTAAEADIAADIPMAEVTSVRDFITEAPAVQPVDTTESRPQETQPQDNNPQQATNGTETDGHDPSIPNGLPSTTPLDGLASTSPTLDTASLPSHRMTTRARSNNNTQNPTPTSPPHSPISMASTEPPPIHPLYQLPTPSSFLPAPNLGLPYSDFIETRDIFFHFVQRQEEIVRCIEQIYHGLMEADRMRKNVLRWSRAEGHVGEMSDGEDWVDAEYWGLDPDAEAGGLVKGKEEEEETEQPGKRRRGRGADKA